MKISINEGQSVFLELEIDGRLYPDAYDYWDGNHLKAIVRFAIPAFTGSFLSNFSTVELHSFLQQLEAINNMNAKECTLSNIDETVFISGVVDYSGALDWNCTLTYPSGNGAVIKFIISTGFSVVSKLVYDIKKVIELWPIVGSPD